LSQPDATILDEIDEMVEQEFDQHKRLVDATARAVRGEFRLALDIIERGLRQGGKLLVFGNGGSAADAQHIAAELVIRYGSRRKAIAAIALTTDTSVLTACGNDLGFDALFERQVEALGRPGDIAVGISTSGESENVLRGLNQARHKGLKTIGLTGGSGGNMAAACDVMIRVPSTVTARIQEMHITIGHVLCKALEMRLGLVRPACSTPS
jgi:D-sedoheptulose 7-phosphate isomerase